MMKFGSMEEEYKFNQRTQRACLTRNINIFKNLSTPVVVVYGNDENDKPQRVPSKVKIFFYIFQKF